MIKIKRKIKWGISALMLGATLTASASEGEIRKNNQLITYLPEQANGFLIMDKVKNPEVETWEVEVAVIGYDEVASEYTYSVVYETSLTETYYTQLSEDLIAAGHFVHVQGIDGMGNAVAETDWLGLCSNCAEDFSPCYWECEGSTYAYSLQLWVDGVTGGSSHITFMATTPDDGTPFYYEYMSQAQFVAGIGSQSLLDYYNVPEWNPYGQGVGDQIIKLTGVAGTDGYTSASGSPLSGTVYGVKKWLGPWGSLQGTSSATIASGADLCVHPIHYAIDVMNDEPGFSGSLALSCDGLGGGEGSPAPPSLDPCEDQPWDLYWDCVVEEMESDPFGISPVSPFWNDEVVSVTLYPFMPEAPVEPIVLSKDDFYTVDMEFSAPAISIEEGLYLYEIQYDNSAIRTTFFDNPTAREYSWDQEDFLNVTFAPVPIVGDEFNMNLVASEGISFTYTLYDFSGNEIYTEVFAMNPGDEETILVAPEGGIPSGELVNRFDFADGSRKTIITMK